MICFNEIAYTKQKTVILSMEQLWKVVCLLNMISKTCDITVFIFQHFVDT